MNGTERQKDDSDGSGGAISFRQTEEEKKKQTENSDGSGPDHRGQQPQAMAVSPPEAAQTAAAHWTLILERLRLHNSRLYCQA